MKIESEGTVKERDYIVCILGEEFRVKGGTRWKAISEAARQYNVKYPGRYKISLLVVEANTRQLPEISTEVR